MAADSNDKDGAKNEPTVSSSTSSAVTSPAPAAPPVVKAEDPAPEEPAVDRERKPNVFVARVLPKALRSS